MCRNFRSLNTSSHTEFLARFVTVVKIPNTWISNITDRRHHHHKHHRRSKDPNSSVPMDDPMDRLVALNVDEVLLDCLEDELPSVTFDGELPGSEPLELVDNYNLCDAMLLCTSRKTRPRPFLRTPSTSSGCSTLDAKEKSGFDEPVSPRRTAVLNRLMSSSSSSPKRKSKTSSTPVRNTRRLARRWALLPLHRMTDGARKQRNSGKQKSQLRLNKARPKCLLFPE